MEPKENEKQMMILNPRVDHLERKMAAIEHQLPVYERTQTALTQRMNQLEQTVEALGWMLFASIGLLILVGVLSRRQ